MKRSKIFITASMFVLSLAFLVVGVYASVVGNFSISGTLSYDPSKIYYDISAQVYRGPDYLGVKPVTNQESYTLANTSEEYTTGNDVIEIAPWSPSSVSFTSTDKFIQYRIIIKNNSNEALSFIPTKDLTQTDVEIVEEASEILRIEAGDTAEYRITYEYTGSGTASTTFIQTFDLQKTSQLLNDGSKYQLAQKDIVFSYTNTYDGGLNIQSGDTPRVLILPSIVDGFNVEKTYGNFSYEQWSIYGICEKISTDTKYAIFQSSNITSMFYTFYNTNIEGVGIPMYCNLTMKGTFMASKLTSIKLPQNISFAYTDGPSDSTFGGAPIVRVKFYKFTDFVHFERDTFFANQSLKVIDMTGVDWNDVEFYDIGSYPPDTSFVTGADETFVIINSQNLNLVISTIQVESGTMINKLYLADSDLNILATWTGTAWKTAKIEITGVNAIKNYLFINGMAVNPNEPIFVKENDVLRYDNPLEGPNPPSYILRFLDENQVEIDTITLINGADCVIPDLSAVYYINVKTLPSIS